MKNLKLEYAGSEPGNLIHYFEHFVSIDPEESIIYGFVACKEAKKPVIRFYECTDDGEPSFTGPLAAIASLEMPPEEDQFDSNLTAYLLALKRLKLDYAMLPPDWGTWVDVLRNHTENAFALADFLPDATSAYEVTKKLMLPIDERRILIPPGEVANRLAVYDELCAAYSFYPDEINKNFSTDPLGLLRSLRDYGTGLTVIKHLIGAE